MTNKQKIGTHFKKENIFLATINVTEKDAKRILGAKAFRHLKEALEKAGTEISKTSAFDVFYKQSAEYLRFFEDGVATYAGDDSDGMGLLTNVVSVWKYFSEDELYEAQLEDGTWVIGMTDEWPAHEYYMEYNEGSKGSVEKPISD